MVALNDDADKDAPSPGFAPWETGALVVATVGWVDATARFDEEEGPSNVRGHLSSLTSAPRTETKGQGGKSIQVPELM